MFILWRRRRNHTNSSSTRHCHRDNHWFRSSRNLYWYIVHRYQYTHGSALDIPTAWSYSSATQIRWQDNPPPSAYRHNGNVCRWYENRKTVSRDRAHCIHSTTWWKAIMPSKCCKQCSAKQAPEIEQNVCVLIGCLGTDVEPAHWFEISFKTFKVRWPLAKHR